MSHNDTDEAAPMVASAHSEHQPLLNGSASNTVDFDPNGDPGNPLEWPERLKRVTVSMLALMAFTITFNCIAVVPLSSRIANELSSGNDAKATSVLLVTIWELGEAAGPLLIAPLSEMFGRYRIMNLCCIVFTTTTMATALSQSASFFIAARLVTGMAVASNVLNPAIVGDIFPPTGRGTAISTFMFATLFGGTVGPAISGAVAQRFGWRAVIWMSVMLGGSCTLAFLTCFRETYRVMILRRRAARLRKSTGNGAIESILDKNEGKEKGGSRLRTSIVRPVMVLLGSGVLVALSLFGAVVFAYFYIVSVTLPSILEDRYGLSPAAVGAAFFANGLGSCVGIVICNIWVDKIYINLCTKSNGVGIPEFRLPLTIVGGFLLPLGITLYGWCAEHKLPMPLILFAVMLVRLTMILSFLPLMAYVVDACGLYSASAYTGIVVLRSLGGAFLPLSTTMLVGNLGYGWGFSALGAFSMLLAPIPVLISRYGLRWRQLSEYTRDA